MHSLQIDVAAGPELRKTYATEKVSTKYAEHQYALWQILGIWALVALPMALLAWIIAPAVIPNSPLHPGITYWLLIIVGMGWECVLSLVLVYRELGTLRWSAIRRRTWLQTPRDPGTDRPHAGLFWWLLPALVFSALVSMVLAPYLNAPMAWLFPGLQASSFTDQSQLVSPAFKGQWWLLGIVLVSHTLNYFHCPGQPYVELFPGRGISLSRCTPAKDARGVWQVRLGGKLRSLRLLSPA